MDAIFNTYTKENLYLQSIESFKKLNKTKINQGFFANAKDSLILKLVNPDNN
jgi:hypothetical protein